METERKKLTRKIYWNIIGLIIFTIASYGFINPWLANEKNNTIILIGLIYLPINFFILILWTWRISKLFHKFINTQNDNKRKFKN